MAIDADLDEHGRAEKLAHLQKLPHRPFIAHTLDFFADPVVEVVEGLGYLSHAIVLRLLHHSFEPNVLLERPSVVIEVVVLNLRHNTAFSFVGL